MTWQDIVIAIGSWIFIISLIPTLIGKEKPAMSTSFPTGVVLLVYAGVYITLHLWLSVVSTAIMAILWLTLGLQKLRAGKPSAAVNQL